MTTFSFVNTYFPMTNYIISFSFHSYFVVYQISVCYHEFSCQFEAHFFSYAFWLFIYFAKFSVKSLNHHLDHRFLISTHLTVVVNQFLFNLVASLSWVYLQLKAEKNLELISFRFLWCRVHFYWHELFKCCENYFHYLNLHWYLANA